MDLESENQALRRALDAYVIFTGRMVVRDQITDAEQIAELLQCSELANKAVCPPPNYSKKKGKNYS